LLAGCQNPSTCGVNVGDRTARAIQALRPLVVAYRKLLAAAHRSALFLCDWPQQLIAPSRRLRARSFWRPSLPNRISAYVLVKREYRAITSTLADRAGLGATRKIEIDPETYEVRADGELLVCEHSDKLPMAQRCFSF
jgi:hypothetical protein